MTIKEFSDELGLSKGAVYKAIKSSRFTLAQITGRNGHITEEGRKILRILYPETPSETLKDEKTEDSTLDDLKTRLSEAEKARDKAEERAEKWEKLYLELQETAAQEREAHNSALREAHVLAAQAQEIAKYYSMNPIKRLFSGKKKPETQGTIH